MSTMTEKQLQDKLDQVFSMESFLTFEGAGKVRYNNESIGIYSDEGDHYKVIFFQEIDGREEYIVKKDSPVKETTSKEKQMNHTNCEALTSKGAPCKNNATHDRDGHKVCGPHLKSKNIKWKESNVQVNEPLDKVVMEMEPEHKEEVKAKIQEIKADLPSNKEEKVYEHIRVFLVSEISRDGQKPPYRTYVYTQMVEAHNLTMEVIKKRAENTLNKEGVVAVVVTGVNPKPWVLTPEKSVLVEAKYVKYRKQNKGPVVGEDDSNETITLRCQHFITDAEGKKRKCGVEFTTTKAERLTGCPDHHKKEA